MFLYTNSSHQVQRYQARLSGPLLDRIDMHVEVPPVPVKDIGNSEIGSSSAQMNARVQAARKILQQRFEKGGAVYSNAQMGPPQLKKYCKLDQETTDILHQSFERLGLSARGYNRILKISRTIADNDESEAIEIRHVTEAIPYRRPRSANM